MNKIKILYVDSNKNYGQEFLSFLLTKEYDVKYITCLKDALIEQAFHNPNLIVSDASLDDGDAFTLFEKAKKLNEEIYTMILTSNSDKSILLEAINHKIDIFESKENPFEQIEQRIKKLKVEEKNEEFDEEKNEEFDLGENYIYNGEYIISPEDKYIKLTTQENKLIRLLTNARGESVAYETIQNQLSSKGITSIDTIRTVIRKIRKKTFNDIIQNQSGQGYKVNFYDSKNLAPINIENDEQINVRILILKGDTKKNEHLAYRLSRYGLSCDNAYTLSQASELLKYQKYDYIITDLNLPDGEGIDFIREFDELYTTKIIVLSSSRDIHYKDYLYFKGILDYIIEIKDLATLAASIYKTISKVEHNTKFNNILIVEQSKKVSEQIKDLLLPRNYEVDILNDLVQAYEVIKSKQYSLVILDINYESCFDFIQNVKNSISKSIPFIVLSDSNRTYSVVREAYTNGAAECLRKPIFAEEFILKVDQHVETSKLIFELSEQKKLLTNYKTIVDQSAIISKTDPRGFITYVNQIFCDISGYSEEELIGHPHNIIRHPDTPREVFKSMWQTIKEKKEIWSGVVKNRAKDGSAYYVQTSIMPILDKNGEIEEFIALRNDISSIYNKQQKE